MLLSEAITAVRTEGGFDSSSTGSPDSVLRSWVWQAVSSALSESKWRKQRREIGPTVAGQAQYLIADEIVEVTALRVNGGRPYTPLGSLTDLWDLQSGNAILRRASGAFLGTYEPDADSVVEIWQAPSESGLSMEALVAITLLDLAQAAPDDATFVLPIPSDLIRPIAVNGAVAIGLRLLEQRHPDAAEHEGIQSAAVKQLTRRANTRVGRGSFQIPIRQP